MAHESFESAEVAAIMNREFVNIKVDREERPDVDRVYMTFVQATTGSGGWPMSVWLTPELKPFVGGTYFPPEDRYGQPGFSKVLERIAAAWKQDHEKIAEQGTKIIAALAQANRAVEKRRDSAPRPWSGLSADRAELRRARRRFRCGAKISAAGNAEFSVPRFMRGQPRIRQRQARARDESFHAPQNGGGRNARSSGWRVSSLLGGCVLARAAFRKNAL